MLYRQKYRWIDWKVGSSTAVESMKATELYQTSFHRLRVLNSIPENRRGHHQLDVLMQVNHLEIVAELRSLETHCRVVAPEAVKTPPGLDNELKSYADLGWARASTYSLGLGDLVIWCQVTFGDVVLKLHPAMLASPLGNIDIFAYLMCKRRVVVLISSTKRSQKGIQQLQFLTARDQQVRRSVVNNIPLTWEWSGFKNMALNWSRWRQHGLLFLEKGQLAKTLLSVSCQHLLCILDKTPALRLQLSYCLNHDR